MSSLSERSSIRIKSKSPIKTSVKKDKLSQGSPVKESEHESGALFPLSLYGLPKRKPSKTLLGSFFDFIEKQNDTVDDSASDDDEEVEQQTLQRSTQGETTIPIYRNTDIEKKSSSISLNKGRKLEDIKDNLKELPVEEDSDGYNLAAHLEHLIEDLTSEESSTDEHNESTEDQVPQFDESVNHTTDHHNSNRGSEWLARKLFNPRLLGPNEKVFSRTRFKAMLRRIIPDQVTIPNSRLPHPPNHRPVKVYNCGTCHFLKLYIVFTLASCIFYFIFLDPCFRIKVFTTLNDTTIQPRPSHQMNVSKTLVNHVSPLKNYKGKGNRRTSRQKKHPKKRSFDDKPKIDAELKNCIFKKAYTVSMFFCLPVYLFIFIVYSCHFVIRYYDFAWFLLEAVFLLISSLFLTILAGFAFKYASDHLFVNIIVITDGTIGLMIAFFTYCKHKLGTDPFSLISNSDREMYEITQILARRQITKLFTLGRDPKQFLRQQGSVDSLTRTSSSSSLVSKC